MSGLLAYLGRYQSGPGWEGLGELYRQAINYRQDPSEMGRQFNRVGHKPQYQTWVSRWIVIWRCWVEPGFDENDYRHSREGGNPGCMLMLLFPLKRKSTVLDSRLRGNDGFFLGGGGRREPHTLIITRALRVSFPALDAHAELTAILMARL